METVMISGNKESSASAQAHWQGVYIRRWMRLNTPLRFGREAAMEGIKGDCAAHAALLAVRWWMIHRTLPDNNYAYLSQVERDALEAFLKAHF